MPLSVAEPASWASPNSSSTSSHLIICPHILSHIFPLRRMGSSSFASSSKRYLQTMPHRDIPTTPKLPQAKSNLAIIVRITFSAWIEPLEKFLSLMDISLLRAMKTTSSFTHAPPRIIGALTKTLVRQFFAAFQSLVSTSAVVNRYP